VTKMLIAVLALADVALLAGGACAQDREEVAKLKREPGGCPSSLRPTSRHRREKPAKVKRDSLHLHQFKQSQDCRVAFLPQSPRRLPSSPVPHPSFHRSGFGEAPELRSR
jgi:hypothetical protein